MAIAMLEVVGEVSNEFGAVGICLSRYPLQLILFEISIINSAINAPENALTVEELVPEMSLIARSADILDDAVPRPIIVGPLALVEIAIAAYEATSPVHLVIFPPALFYFAKR